MSDNGRQAAGTDAALQLEGVSHSFGPVEVLQDIRLQVRRGEFVAIVGPSGCGKTTILNLLSGFYTPGSGQVIRNGLTRTVHQQDGLFPWLTAGQNIELGLRHVADAAEKQKQLEELLALVRLNAAADRYPRQLSGGMRQRAELARAMAGHPEILLLDEPFSALDYQARLQMRREMSRLLERRPHTVVLVTHDIEEAAQLADRVVMLSQRPARICRELLIGVPRPRLLTSDAVVSAVREILTEMGLEEN